MSYSFFKKWSEQFDHQYPVQAGESLKDIDHFAQHVKNILPMLAGYNRRECVIVAVGGGTVGDFAGFLSSILKRGVGYVSLPSTWLAVVDSAHGGKTGLNVDDLKNQVGTFYEPSVVFCVKELLMTQTRENVQSAYGEVIKMALLTGAQLFSRLKKLKTFDAQNLWRLLPMIVEAKLRVVRRDPLEKKGLRHLLNLGHTMGHAFELESLISHGMAVQMGLEFTAEWSRKKNLLNPRDYAVLKNIFAKNSPREFVPLPVQRLRLRLRQDKKTVSGNRVKYVFIQKPGRARIEEVNITDVVTAAYELGWAK